MCWSSQVRIAAVHLTGNGHELVDFAEPHRYIDRLLMQITEEGKCE